MRKEKRQHMDTLNRLFIPLPLRKQLFLKEKELMEITLQHGQLYLQKFTEEGWKERPFVGIVRAMDSLGRVCIPKEYCKLLNIQPAMWYRCSLVDSTIVITLESSEG